MLKSEDLTIYIPTRNNISTFTNTLKSLRSQNLRPHVYVVDSHSMDGTREALKKQIDTKYYKDLQLHVLDVPPPDRPRPQSICKVRHFCSDHCKTIIMMFVDSDVLLPPNILNPMLEYLTDNVKVGMLGIRYDPRATHVKLGCTMLYSHFTKLHKWRIDEDCCECLNYAKDLFFDGNLSEHYPDQTARHMLRY